MPARSEHKLSKTDLAQFPQDVHRYINAASDIWEDVYNVITYARRALFYGRPGSGKSRVSSVHELNGRSLERSTITPETCWPEIRGFWAMGKNGMDWMNGPGIRAWLNGSRWVVDEIDQAGGDTVPGLHMLLDDSAVARLTLPNGETVRPAESFQCFATTNADPRSLPEALADRFVIKREVNHPDPRILLSLPRVLRPAAAYSLYSPDGATELKAMTSRAWVELGTIMDRHGLNVRDGLTVIVGSKLAKNACLAVEVAASKVAAIGAAVEATI